MSEDPRAAPLRTAVIVGSTRETRAGDGIGRWFAALAAGRDDHEVDLLDLAAWEFPARRTDTPDAAVTAFTRRLARADGFVVVTPEYNRSFPAALKQAVDYGFDEWQAKPVAFVSYGYRWAGRYAVEQLRSVFTELHAVTLRDGLHLDLRDNAPDGADSGDHADGTAFPGDAAAEDRHRVAHRMLDRLSWWGLTLREGRAARPYVG
ncbi:NADPH-dependent FMN reductase [Streptomyces bohaiensis]|uniref:NAD(P)H-dependent oxidoreductase n=1 Tax=Streptomyces bohaiensis TaxID=1431344 RepID=A0ABX1CHH9_9ACTN|nr:NAD(P)H-dependent oxidoreductase [Streptomyces bohaiensis]NJQ17383.1 NAD(P)H-dependent oxidoreductase [Streptomyces bohaiensis]